MMNSPNSHSLVILLRDYPEFDLQVGDVGLVQPALTDGSPPPDPDWRDTEFYSPILGRMVTARVREDDLLLAERVAPPGMLPTESDESFPPSA